MPKVAVVIPVFNEEETIRITVSKMVEASVAIIQECPINQVELVFVDDGSVDKSLTILRELSHSVCKPEVTFKILQFSRNFGHSAAVFAGLEAAEADLYAILDADLQDPPELLIPMISVLFSQNADVVYGLRRVRHGEGLSKRFTAWLFYRLINLLSAVPIPKDTGDFRVFKDEVRNIIIRLNEVDPFLRGLVAWTGFNQVPFPYDRQSRKLGQTKYPFKKMLRFATQAILSFSSFPLRIAIYSGLFGIVVSTLVAAHALRVWSKGEAIPGWTSLIIGITFGQSMTFLLVGILGLYVAHIHKTSQGRPRYIIREESK